MTAEEFNTTFGTKIKALAEYSTVDETTGKMTFTELTDKTIKAGKPYLIKVESNANVKGTNKDKDSENYYAVIKDKQITAPEPEKIKANYDDTNSNGYGIVNGDFYFCGLYGKKNTDDNGVSIAGNQQYQYISTKEGQPLCYLPTDSKLSFTGLRAYLYFPNWNAENNNKYNDATTPQNKALTIGIGDGTTGINVINAEVDADGGKVYNLAGQYVGNSTNGLGKGIYIRNGKKFVIK